MKSIGQEALLISLVPCGGRIIAEILFCRQDFLCGEGRDDTVSAGLIQIRVWFLAIAGDIGIVACEYGTGLLLLRLSLPILAVYPVQLMESPYKRCMLGHDLNQTR